jgi:hypothetical protein
MRSLSPQRRRILLYYLLSVLLLAASFVERHLKARLSIEIATEIGFVAFMLAGLSGLYNLTGE